MESERLHRLRPGQQHLVAENTSAGTECPRGLSAVEGSLVAIAQRFYQPECQLHAMGGQRHLW